MHDYQLERLNTRSFEQLVQALGTEIIGSQLMIFGDGADGGREAIFEGPVKYPSGKKAWNGYGIVQAKFRQKPDSEPKKNADWAIAQIKSEFKNFKQRPKGKKAAVARSRLCPEYYVFATNLILSPVSEKGGKDRVRSVLDGFKDSHGLKDYAIWDGDQIRTFLDAQPAIRTTYTAWLLPGDVLAAIIKHLHLENTPFPSTIRRYLESELLDDQFARLGQGGYTDAKNIPLSSVFIDLPVESSGKKPSLRDKRVSTPDLSDSLETEDEKQDNESQPHFLHLFFEEGRKVLKPSANVPAKDVRFSIDKNGRVVLVGGPGQGKTTVGQFACQLLRAELLRATGGPFSPEVSQALERIEKMSEGMPQVNARRYPLRIDLKHLAASLATTGDEHAKNLFDYLLKRIANRTNSQLKPEDFRRWLTNFPWLLVLDGLDEVPASSNRQQVMQAIRDFISVEAHAVDADLLVLATTRPQGYSDEFDPSFYTHLSLKPLNAEQALGYGSRLATARHPGQKTRVEELTSSLKRATRNPATVRLMQSPLQVTIMLALIEGGGEPPEQRWKLFRDYYDVIYRREKERGTPFSAILGRYEPDIHWIHHRAGWLLQQRNATAGSTDARLRHEEFEQLVDGRLKGSGHEDQSKRQALVKEIRLAATDRLVLLVGNTEDEIGFEIRSLQEFMASEHFFDGGESCVQKTLHAIAPYPYWRNVFLFAAGRVFFERQELIDCVIAVCGEMNETTADPAQSATVSGSRIALALLKDGAARNQPASIRVIARYAARCLDTLDDESVANIGELFSGEAEEVWKEELKKRLTTVGFPHHNWLLCLKLIESGKSWATELFKNHFPWDNEQTEQFLALLSGRNKQLPKVFTTAFCHNALRFPLRILPKYLNPGEHSPLLSCDFLEQFIPLFSDNENEQRWPLKIGAIPSGLEFRIQGSESLSLWASFTYPDKTLQKGHPEWRVYQAVSSFAKTPTKEGLADMVTNISQMSFEVSKCQAWWLFPWQIGVCMWAKNAGYAWEEIVSAIKQGKLGSEADWVRWERNNQDGITLAQFRYDGLSITDEAQGLILLKSSWSFSSTNQVDQVIQGICELAPKFPAIAQQYTLIEVCCAGIAPQDDLIRDYREAPLSRLINLCFEQKAPLSGRVLTAVIACSLPDGEKLNLLSKSGQCHMRQGWFGNWNRNSQKIANQFAAVCHVMASFEKRADVLVALSRLPPHDTMQHIPENLLAELDVMGDAYRNAAVVLRTNSLRWKAQDAKKLVNDLIALQTEYPQIMSRLFDYIELSGKAGPQLETFLLELLANAPAIRNSTLLGRATSLLVKLVERRTAINTLPDPTTRFQSLHI